MKATLSVGSAKEICVNYKGFQPLIYLIKNKLALKSQWSSIFYR